MLLKYFQVLFIFLLPVAALSALELDPAYPKNFGWGIVLASSKGHIAKDKCDMTQFDYSNGKFNLVADENVELFFRVLLKDGKTFGYYTDQVRKANIKKSVNLKYEFYTIHFFVSHEDGSEQFRTWPSKLGDIPDWNEYFSIENTLDDKFSAFNGCGYPWSDITSTTDKLQEWIKNARKGYRIYFYVNCGFVREALENKHWDDTQLKYVVPVEYVGSEPLAAGTIEITGSTNPLMMWSYKIVTMPEKFDGSAKGKVELYKNDKLRKTVGFTIIEQEGNKGTYSIMLSDIDESSGFRGSFLVTSGKIEDALDSAVYQLIGQGLKLGRLVE